MALGLAALLAIASGGLDAQAIRTNGGFTTNTLPRNDDGSTPLVNLGFTVNFFGLIQNQAYVNNNGNITFDATLPTFTPFPLIGTERQIIAPFFADIDTRAPSPGVTQYGQDVVNGRAAFGVNWLDVGYYQTRADKLNSIQLVLIDRSDVNPGDFDFEFNYGSIQWEVGTHSTSEGPGANGNGLCDPGETQCRPARAGWSNGTVASFEVAGSGTPGAFLDGGANALASNSLNSTVTGRYVFEVRNGVVLPPPPPMNVVPEPSTVLLLGTGLLGLAAVHRRRGRHDHR